MKKQELLTYLVIVSMKHEINVCCRSELQNTCVFFKEILKQISFLPNPGRKLWFAAAKRHLETAYFLIIKRSHLPQIYLADVVFGPNMYILLNLLVYTPFTDDLSGWFALTATQNHFSFCKISSCKFRDPISCLRRKTKYKITFWFLPFLSFCLPAPSELKRKNLIANVDKNELPGGITPWGLLRT